MTAAYVLGIVCGIAVLFLLKFHASHESRIAGPAHATGVQLYRGKNMFQKKQANVSASARATYAVPGDFCRIFTEDQTALYLLAFALTADSEKAEQCFGDRAGGFDPRKPGLQDWARS